jgi:hypothetical protein
LQVALPVLARILAPSGLERAIDKEHWRCHLLGEPAHAGGPVPPLETGSQQIT